MTFETFYQRYKETWPGHQKDNDKDTEKDNDKEKENDKHKDKENDKDALRTPLQSDPTRIILGTCDPWDMWWEWWGDMT